MEILRVLSFSFVIVFVMGGIGAAIGLGVWLAVSIPKLLDRLTGINRPKEESWRD